MLGLRSWVLLGGLLPGCLQGSESETGLARIETFGSPIVMDNSSPDFEADDRRAPWPWTSETSPPGKYWGTDYLRTQAGGTMTRNGNRTVEHFAPGATWTFRDLPRDDYRIRVAFPMLPTNSRAARYILYLHADGGITAFYFTVDQTRVGRDGFVELVDDDGLRRFPLGGPHSIADFQLGSHISDPGDVLADAVEVTPVVTLRAGASCSLPDSATGAACIEGDEPVGEDGWTCGPGGDNPYPWIGTTAAVTYGRARCVQCDGADDNGDGCCSTDQEDAGACECVTRGGWVECEDGSRACADDGCGPTDEVEEPRTCDVTLCDDGDACTIDLCDEIGCYWQWDEWCDDECADLGGWADCDDDGFQEACFCDCYDCSE